NVAPGVVDEDIDLADSVHRRLSQGTAAILNGDVEFQRQGPPAQGFDLTAPARASVAAKRRPSPRLAPVTIACLPVRSNIAVLMGSLQASVCLLRQTVREWCLTYCGTEGNDVLSVLRRVSHET